MADLSKCCGICINMVPTSVIGITEEAEVPCPERDSCFRYICKAHENQSWIAPPYNFATKKCEMQIQQISRECGCGHPALGKKCL